MSNLTPYQAWRRRSRAARTMRLHRDASRLAWMMRGYFLYFLIPAVGVIAIIVGTVQFLPAWRAALGHGTAGYFVVSQRTCDKQGNCYWLGDFAGPGGQVTRHDISFDGSHAGFHAGLRVAALDTGDPGKVYPRHGTLSWLRDLAGAVFGVAVLAAWIWFLPLRNLRRLRQGRP